MPFTSLQQAKLDAAQQQLDAAKATYQGFVSSYNDYASGITPCFDKNKPWYDFTQATSWWQPDRSDCVGGITKKQGCNASDKNQCQSFVDYLNTTTIPGLRAAYSKQLAAQSNYDKVFNEVAAEAAADPQLQLDQAEIEANAEANKLKWIFWIAVVVVVAIAAFVWFKWIRK